MDVKAPKGKAVVGNKEAQEAKKAKVPRSGSCEWMKHGAVGQAEGKDPAAQQDRGGAATPTRCAFLASHRQLICNT